MLLPSSKDAKGQLQNGDTLSFTSDPGLPVPNPTVPEWQVPLHDLSNVSSASLPQETDILIIGSGMTGCSAAKTILEGSPDLRVTVLEARGLASGASSRNGGHIVSPSFGDFSKLVDTLGREMAVKVAVFTNENCEKTFEMVDGLADGGDVKTKSEIRRTEKCIALQDESLVGEVEKMIQLWNEIMPKKYHDEYRLISGKEAEEKFGLQNVAGAAVGRAAAVWPYRLWTGVWSLLLKTYPSRLNIETFTPAESVSRTSSNGGGSYEISTPKGSIRAAKVVYAANGFTPHLLPSLQGKIYPWRGTMSCQDLGKDFPNRGAERSWSFISESRMDEELGAPNSGLYYLTQNGVSGHMFLGGENENLADILTSDDSVVNPHSAKKIGNVLPGLFKGAPQPVVKRIWSGIMGFTKDGLPLVGKLPEFVTGRQGSEGEYIAAGFNGYGTGYCFLCGKAVGEMILGKDTTWLPEAFAVTKDRFEGALVSSPFHGHLLPS